MAYFKSETFLNQVREQYDTTPYVMEQLLLFIHSKSHKQIKELAAKELAKNGKGVKRVTKEIIKNWQEKLNNDFLECCYNNLGLLNNENKDKNQPEMSDYWKNLYYIYNTKELLKEFNCPVSLLVNAFNQQNESPILKRTD
jgi:hypothetical protein